MFAKLKEFCTKVVNWFKGLFKRSEDVEATPVAPSPVESPVDPVEPVETVLPHLTAPSTRAFIKEPTTVTEAAKPMGGVPKDRLTLHSPFRLVLKEGRTASVPFDFTGWVNFGNYEAPGTDRAAEVRFKVGDVREVVGTYDYMPVECKGPGVLEVVSDRATTLDVVPKVGKAPVVKEPREPAPPRPSKK